MQVSPFIVGQPRPTIKGERKTALRNHLLTNVSGNSGCGRERAEQTLLAGWATDPVHPNAPIYAKMALNVLEKVALSNYEGEHFPKTSEKGIEVGPRVLPVPAHTPHCNENPLYEFLF